MTNRLASVLGGDAGAAVLPRLAAAAAPVCGQPWSAFAADAGQIVQAAKRIAALFATDAIVIEIDASDSDAAVEAVRRLAAENGRPVVPILPGPVTLAATAPRRWVLSVDYASIDELELYVSSGGSKVSAASVPIVMGRALPFSQHPLPSAWHAAAIELEPGGHHELLLRVRFVPLTGEQGGPG